MNKENLLKDLHMRFLAAWSDAASKRDVKSIIEEDYSSVDVRDILKISFLESEVLDQLQAETQRADKAEEMVAAFRESLKSVLSQECYCIFGCGCGTYEIRNEAQKVLDSLSAQAFRQKLCDEIVGKIEAKYDKDCNSNQEYFVGFSVGLLKAIDIVKSVLSEKE